MWYYFIVVPPSVSQSASAGASLDTGKPRPGGSPEKCPDGVKVAGANPSRWPLI